MGCCALPLHLLLTLSQSRGKAKGRPLSNVGMWKQQLSRRDIQPWSRGQGWSHRVILLQGPPGPVGAEGRPGLKGQQVSSMGPADPFPWGSISQLRVTLVVSILGRAMQDLVELRVSAVLAGREGNVGQQGCQGGPGSRERRYEQRSLGIGLGWGC